MNIFIYKRLTILVSKKSNNIKNEIEKLFYLILT